MQIETEETSNMRMWYRFSRVLAVALALMLSSSQLHGAEAALAEERNAPDAASVGADLEMTPPRNGLQSVSPEIQKSAKGITIAPSTRPLNDGLADSLDLSLTRIGSSTIDRLHGEYGRGAMGVDTADGLTIARQFDDGIQVIEKIKDRQSKHRFVYEIEATGRPVTFELDRDGSVLMKISNPGSRKDRVVGVVDRPWAVDASGETVGARYRLRDGGRQLVLNVDKASSYPILADPSVHTTWYGLYTLKLETYYANKLKNALLAGVGASAIAGWICTGLSGGLCSIPWGLSAGIITLGRAAIGLCQNSKGVDIHSWTAAGIPAVWCSGY